MTYDVQDILGYIASFMAIAMYCFYILMMVKGRTRPHLLSWVLWSILSGIGFLAQLAGGAGIGAYALGFTAASCVVISALGIKYGEKGITRGDWLCFAGALAAIILWLVTSDPLWSLILVVAIDAAAFWPTIRKTWIRPYTEPMTTYALSIVKFSFAIAALEQFNIVTLLYPAYLMAMNVFFVVMLVVRRSHEKRKQPLKGAVPEHF